VSTSPSSVAAAKPDDSRVRAFGAVAAAVAGEHELPAILEIAAEQTRRVLGVSSVSISRWDLERGLLRTLINVGELAPDEERWPADEVYALSEFPAAHALLCRGEPHTTVVDDPDADEAERALLHSLGKSSSAAVPVVHAGVTWGELYVANGADVPALRPIDVEFLQAICFQLALAIGRAELFAELSAAAHRDGLTGLVNRRAFDERLDALDAHGDLRHVLLALGDLDGLKLRNDRDGHEAGDRALRLVGRVLAEVCGSDLVAARIGGDEFCIIMADSSESAARALVADVDARLVAADPTVTISWGIGVGDAETRGARAILQVADQRQYAAKRASLRSRGPSLPAQAPPRRGVRVPASASATGSDDRTAALLALLAEDGLALLDAWPGAGAEVRCAAIAELVAERVGGAASDDGLTRAAAAGVVELLRREACREDVGVAPPRRATSDPA
jgi:diguanylate cyclase (GGDEF)-like protein